MLSVPFRILPSGHAAKIDDTSDEAMSQLIAAAVMTRIGERPLWPTYGLPDPVFSKVDGAQLAAVLATYGPKVQIFSINTDFTDSSTQEVDIVWGDSSNVES